jgi:hypothetical protein
MEPNAVVAGNPSIAQRRQALRGSLAGHGTSAATQIGSGNRLLQAELKESPHRLSSPVRDALGSRIPWPEQAAASTDTTRHSRWKNRPDFDILPSLKGGDSYWFHAEAGIPLGGSCHDGLTSPEDDEKASEASPASLTFLAPTKSAWAENPHLPQTNFACDLRFSADTCPHSGHLRLVFCGVTGTSRLPIYSCSCLASLRLRQPRGFC